MEYAKCSREELEKILEAERARLEEINGKNLKLDLSRGKPSADQLELSMDMLSTVEAGSVLDSECGTDCRNYGMPDGIPEARRLMAHMMGTHSAYTMVMGNSSLTIMYAVISHAMTHGILGEKPWYEVKDRKFLCPAPGYDRHFEITRHFGFELITVPMKEDGPDMDMVEELVRDGSVKGIWCVPKYQNPTGITFSDEVVRRFAALKPAAKDFRIFWDNAYNVHHLYDEPQDVILELLSECEKAGNPDMVYKFSSTSKISFPGSGVAAISASKANLDDFRKYMQVQTIGHDKLNQLRHVRYFKDIHGIETQMKKHAEILRPKFEAVLEILDRELGDLEIGTWTKPHGGYFISFEALDGCAKAIVAKAKEAGVVMTGAGATYPYKKDPHDSNIRIAPSFPPIDELVQATELFVLCVKLVSVDKLLENM